jgi:hypothetical protein
VAERVVLHVGAMKSGTSFLQNVLGTHKDALAEQGVLFAGARWMVQVKAVREFINHGGKDQPPLRPDGHFGRLVEEINAWSGTAVVSMEFLGPRSTPQIERLAAAFPGARVDAVISARDLGRTVPAMWLESTQNGGTTDWGDFLAAVRRGPGRGASSEGQGFWRHQAIPAMAKRWADVLGHDHLTVLTVPRPGAPSTLLWERFASILGVDPAGYDLQVRANPSIGLATAELLVELNRRMVLPDGSLPKHYDPLVKHALAKRGLVARQGQEPRLGLDEPWVLEAGRQQVERLRAAGHPVVGDLDELLPGPVKGVHADDVTTEQRYDAAVDGLAHLLDLMAAQRKALKRAERQLAKRTPQGRA